MIDDVVFRFKCFVSVEMTFVMKPVVMSRLDMEQIVVVHRSLRNTVR